MELDFLVNPPADQPERAGEDFVAIEASDLFSQCPSKAGSNPGTLQKGDAETAHAETEAVVESDVNETLLDSSRIRRHMLMKSLQANLP